MLDDRLNFMTQWQQIQVAIKPGDDRGFNGFRLDGPWTAKKLYTARALDCSRRLWVSNEQFFQPAAMRAQMELPLDQLRLIRPADLRRQGFNLNLNHPAGRNR
jgi:hypothetical protein